MRQSTRKLRLKRNAPRRPTPKRPYATVKTRKLVPLPPPRPDRGPDLFSL